jgi:Tannase and feruloyl esterase
MPRLLLALLCLKLLISASADSSPAVQSSPSEKCAALKTQLHLDNTTIIDATHVAAGSNVTTPGSCQSSALSTVAVCRVQAVVNTTATSAVHFEAWLPDEWFGRFLGIGNGGLDGCRPSFTVMLLNINIYLQIGIDYLNLDYGSTLHFASVGSDNGHDGQDGRQFLNNPEVINDFAFRAVHVEAVLGKQIVEAYYGTPHHKSYYLGCSTGGRQATQEALLFPEDFDGLVAGSPATDFNNLGGRQVLLGRFVGAPSHTTDSFIPATLWPIISQEILKQCDGLDGVMDGIITDPDLCTFRPEALLCSSPTSNTSQCVTAPQVAALRNIYQPIFGTEGQLLYPRYDPGAESAGNFIDMFSGDISSLAAVSSSRRRTGIIFIYRKNILRTGSILQYSTIQRTLSITSVWLTSILPTPSTQEESQLLMAISPPSGIGEERSLLSMVAKIRYQCIIFVMIRQADPRIADLFRQLTQVLQPYILDPVSPQFGRFLPSLSHPWYGPLCGRPRGVGIWPDRELIQFSEHNLTQHTSGSCRLGGKR